MLLGSPTVRDSIKQAKVAYGNQDYITTVEKVFQVLCGACKDSSVRHQKYLLKAAQLISDVLLKAVQDKESFSDAVSTLLQRCKISLRHIETMDLAAQESNIAKDIERLIGELDPLWIQERTLFKQFERLSHTAECSDVLEEKSQIFAELARVNAKYIPDKTSLLKTCIFLRASLESTCRNSSTILKEMKSIHRKLLRLSGGKSLSSDLYEASRTVQTKVDVMRQRLEVELKNDEIIPNKETKESLEKYVSKIKNISSSFTDDYADLEKGISGICVDILGSPPCKFSHFNLGTCGSGDFPPNNDLFTAVVLENSIKKKENYAETVEYFQWYLLIFQVILFSGNIQTDNESKTGGDGSESFAKQWLDSSYDFAIAKSITPMNINISLIKTVDDMVAIACQRDQSYGEYLAQMLTRTRHIAGSDSVHKKFKKRTRKEIYSKGVDGSNFKNAILEKLSKLEPKNFSFHSAFADNNDVAEASSISGDEIFQLVDALGHIGYIEKNSAFAIVKTLISKGILDHKAGCSLQIGLAIACESRMRGSLSLSRNADDNKTSTCNSLEKQKVIKLLFALSGIQKVKNSLLNSSGNISVIKSLPIEMEDIADKAEILSYFGWYQDALDILESASSQGHERTNPAFEHFMKGLCLSKVQRLDEANATLKRSMAVLCTLPEVDQSKFYHFIQYLLGINNLKLKNYSQARDHLEQAKKAFESRKDLFSHRGDELYLEVLDGIGESHYRLEDYNLSYLASAELLSQYESMTAKRHEIMFKASTRQGNCLFKLGNFSECVKTLEKALELASSITDMSEEDEKHLKEHKPMWSLQLADCYFKMNEIETAQEYCDGVMKSASSLSAYTTAQVLLISAQCKLWQNRGGEASKEACESISSLLRTQANDSTILSMIQTGVTVISRSMSPMIALHNGGKETRKHDGEREAVFHASQAFDTLCQQCIFTGNELQRDKSILIRVIQTGLFRTKGYGKILNLCKSTVELFGGSNNGNADEKSISRNILDVIDSDECLRNSCVQDCDYFCQAAKYCNTRDAFSISGAIIVFAGSLYRCTAERENSTIEALKDWLAQQSQTTKISVLHCCVKIAKYVVEQFLSKADSSNVPQPNEHQRIPFLDFLADIYEVLKLHVDLSTDLLQETASLTATTASCWMKVQNHERALTLLNDALKLQEKLALDITSIVYVDSNAIIQDIGICLAKLGRWEEANSYLNRGSAIKERRRKSRAYEDYTMIHARVKSARCSFSLGNYQEAVFMASTAFQDGLNMESMDNHDDSMVSAVGIVLRSTLAVAAKAEVEADKSLIKPDTISEVLDRATNMRATLENNSDVLGSVYAETVESFYYACGNCLLAIEHFKQAMKSFKKSLKIMKEKGADFTAMKQPITLNIAKCLIGLKKYKKAEKYLNRFLETAPGKTRHALHSHPSHAYLLLSVCSLRRNLSRKSYQQATKSLWEAFSTDSDILKQQISKECTAVYLQLLEAELLLLDLD